MDALSLLKSDHDKVRKLFEEAEQLTDRARSSRQAIFDEIDEELTLHARVEEKIFYPAFRERAEKSDQLEEVLEALEEHAVAKRLIKEIEKLEPSDERFKPKLSVLIESVKHHADEEETTMFPMARKLFSRDELEELGEQIEMMKEKAGVNGRERARR